MEYRYRTPRKSLGSIKISSSIEEDLKYTLHAMEIKQALENKFNELKEKLIQNIRAHTNKIEGVKKNYSRLQRAEYCISGNKDKILTITITK